MTTEFDSSIRELCAADSSFAQSYQGYQSALQNWHTSGLLTRADIAERQVLDWECGTGVFTALFSQWGAARVFGIDSWLDTDHIPQVLRDRGNIRFEKSPLEPFAEQRAGGPGFDLIFANTVTEHLSQLPHLLNLCYQLLAPAGILFLNHDNYYQPVGSHDHGFLYWRNDEIAFLGPRCWEKPEKCSVSADFRASIAQRYPWTWDARTEGRLTPDDCGRCPYYRRAQPWAHLLYQSEFRDVFPQSCFTTGYSKSSLNKIPPFLLRQFIIEAGFDVERWSGSQVKNVPPLELLRAPHNFNPDDLRTTTIAVRCRKAASVPYE